jgi:hypothetical protein
LDFYHIDFNWLPFQNNLSQRAEIFTQKDIKNRPFKGYPYNCCTIICLRVVIKLFFVSNKFGNPVKSIPKIIVAFAYQRVESNKASRIYLYISDSKIVGCCIAEHIDSAFRVVTSLPAEGGPPPPSALLVAPPPVIAENRDERVYYCSRDPERACVGINR